MPSTTHEQAARWPGGDFEAVKYLEDYGWRITEDWNFYHHKTYYNNDVFETADEYIGKEYDAILYLQREWDYGLVLRKQPDAVTDNDERLVFQPRLTDPVSAVGLFNFVRHMREKLSVKGYYRALFSCSVSYLDDENKAFSFNAVLYNTEEDYLNSASIGKGRTAYGWNVPAKPDEALKDYLTTIASRIDDIPHYNSISRQDFMRRMAQLIDEAPDSIPLDFKQTISKCFQDACENLLEKPEKFPSVADGEFDALAVILEGSGNNETR